MKGKKYSVLALLLALLMMLTVAFAACSKDGETDGDGNGDGTGTEQPGGEEEEVEEPITVDVDVTLVHAPVISYDSSDSGLTDDSIKTDTLVFSYPGTEVLDLYIEKGANVTVTNGTTRSENNVTTNTYTVTAKAAGDYVLRIKKGDDLAAKYTFNVAEAYPEKPTFNRLAGYGQTSSAFMAIAASHDPVVIEENGVYYSFSTDNSNTFGYQVRRSEDMIYWEYVGTAIEGEKTQDAARTAHEHGSGSLQEVYNHISADGDWSTLGAGDNKGPNWTLWAPDVVKGADGKYWLYASWTADFGSKHSIIFLCKADSIAGPYKYDSIIVYTYDSGGSDPNGIDASVYSDPDGNLYMAYGSFAGGIWCIKLDPETGRRLDGLTGADLLPNSSKSKSERNGQRLVANGDTEGSVVTYVEGLETYSGDPAQAFDPSKVQAQNLYVMMSSSNSLSSNYNMRSYTSAQPYADTFRGYGSTTSGSLVTASFSWKLSEEDADIGFDFGYPGHNDMITTSTGKNLLAYHNRISFGSGTVNHYLFTSLYGYNSRGELVMNPNRYAGENERVITADEIVGISGGKYSFAYASNVNYGSSFNKGYAMLGLTFEKGGALKYNGAAVGAWTLYGDNWVYVNITTEITASTGGGKLSGKFYGMAFPAYLESEGVGGISMSFVSEDGQRALYMNADFTA